MVLVEKTINLLEKKLKQSKIVIWNVWQCCKLDFFQNKPLRKKKCQFDTFHEVLPGNLVFFHFCYIRTKELEYLGHTTELYMKSYISEWNCTCGGRFLSKRFRKQAVRQDENPDDLTQCPNSIEFEPKPYISARR